MLHSLFLLLFSTDHWANVFFRACWPLHWIAQKGSVPTRATPLQSSPSRVSPSPFGQFWSNIGSVQSHCRAITAWIMSHNWIEYITELDSWLLFDWLDARLADDRHNTINCTDLLNHQGYFLCSALLFNPILSLLYLVLRFVFHHWNAKHSIDYSSDSKLWQHHSSREVIQFTVQ